MSSLRGILSPYTPLREVVSDIVIERVRKGLWSSVEVVVRATLKERGFRCNKLGNDLPQ